MAVQQHIKARSIYAGFEWRLRVTIDGVEPFAADARFAAQIRRQAKDPALATLTTENGGVVRINSRSLELVLPGDASADWEQGQVLIDVVRVAPEPKRNLGFRLTVPVKQSITRDFT
jgi:hypothetical protein